jgi:hypothetical protein
MNFGFRRNDEVGGQAYLRFKGFCGSEYAYSDIDLKGFIYEQNGISGHF